MSAGSTAPVVSSEPAPPQATHIDGGDRDGPAHASQAPDAALLTTVPRPPPGQDVVDLGGATAGGLTARYARWAVDGAEVLLTGEAPFVDLTAHAGVRADGSFDGSARVHAAVRLLGLPIAEAEWTVAGWTPDDTLPGPAVRLRGTTLDVDLTPIGPQVALRPTEGLVCRRTETGAQVDLPDGALPPGRPLEPRVVDLFATLRGWDVAGLRVHPDASVEAAPAFVSDADLFFAPGRYGLDSPQTAALLDAALCAALAGAVGPVSPTPPAPAAEPAPDAGSTRAARTERVPAEVPETPTVKPVAAEGPAEGAAPGPATEEPAAEPAEVDPEAAAAQAEATPQEEAAASAEVELLMPPAPADPGPAALARASAVGGGARAAARKARDLPPADAVVDKARGAVTEPAAETAARAREGLAAALGERPAPSPQIVELCERIRTAIREQRPVDEDDLLGANPKQAAQGAGATVETSVEGQVDEVEGGYADLENPPAGTPALTPTPLTPPDSSSPGIGVDATSAAPDPIPDENLSLDADVAATDQRIADAGVDTRVTQEIPDAPFSTVRDSRGELGEMTEQTPAELAAAQAAAIERSQADMATLQRQAEKALQRARAGTVVDVTGGQGETVAGEELTRKEVSTRAQTMFDTAKQQVTTLLEPLSRTAMARWSTGLAQASQRFDDALDRVQDWVDERHSGATGFVVGLGDAVFGMPDWVIREYDRAERQFGDDICDLLLEISTDVNSVVAAAQAIIAQVRDDIDAELTNMEEQFPAWAAQQRARFAGMLDDLSAEVTTAQTSFVRDVSRAAMDAVADAQAAVEERREVAKGVVGRIVSAIEEFIEDPVRAIINGLLSLVGIPPAAFWSLVARIEQVASDIADDPEGFINNLTAGLRLGFEQFFARFGTHVLKGFWDWLFSGLDVPIPLPSDLSPRSLFTFALQLMGITWPRVREILVRHVGEQNLETVEAAWDLISALIELGPQGLVDLVAAELTPAALVRTILEAAVEYLLEVLITQVVVRVVGLLNPVGAVAQAIDLIYQVCAWIFRNAARVFRFVEAVVNGMADVVAGNIAGLANAVEQALASLIPPVIDFLAGLMHLGGLPNQVADVIESLRERVYQVMERVIEFLAKQARALLRAVGLGGEEEEEAEEDSEGGDDQELGTTVRFSGAGESHRVYVATAGTAATLMVASTPVSIENKVQKWGERLGELDEDARGAARTKLKALTDAVKAADELADDLARKLQQAATNPTHVTEPPIDGDLENQERSIALMLSELFEIFEGPEPATKWLAEMADLLPGEGQNRADTVVGRWRGRLAQFTIGNQPDDQRLWTDTVLDGAGPRALAVATDPGQHQLLLPYFQAAPRERGVHTGAFRSYVFTQTNPPHSVQRTFREAYGKTAEAALRDEAYKRIAAAEVGIPVQEHWREKVDEVKFRWDAPGGGTISWPTGYVPDHERFLPVNIRSREEGGVRTTNYDTVAGQHFTVTRDASAGLTITVVGKNLRFRAERGRGRTEGHDTFTADNGFDRSHIVADEFGGSGWAVGGNVVTASAEYNQEVMREAERNIGRSIQRWATNQGLDETEITFSMTVTVSFGALRDPAALAEIKGAEWFPAADAGRDLDAEITAKINAGRVHKDLMRITGVVYEWEFTEPAGGGGYTSIGRDLRLLTSG